MRCCGLARGCLDRRNEALLSKRRQQQSPTQVQEVAARLTDRSVLDQSAVLDPTPPNAACRIPKVTRPNFDAAFRTHFLPSMLQRLIPPPWSTQLPLWKMPPKLLRVSRHPLRYQKRAALASWARPLRVRAESRRTITTGGNAKQTSKTRACTTAVEVEEEDVEVMETTTDVRRAIWAEGSTCE